MRRRLLIGGHVLFGVGHGNQRYCHDCCCCHIQALRAVAVLRPCAFSEHHRGLGVTDEQEHLNNKIKPYPAFSRRRREEEEAAIRAELERVRLQAIAEEEERRREEEEERKRGER